MVAAVSLRFSAYFLKRPRKLRDEASGVTARNCGYKGTEYLKSLTKRQAKDPTFASVGGLAVLEEYTQSSILRNVNLRNH